LEDDQLICKYLKSIFFNPIALVKIENIDNLDVHKGPNPTVTVRCYDEKYTIDIHFTGDMERQKFIELLLDAQEGGGEEQKGDEKAEEGEDDDDSSDMAVNDESEEEEIKAIIYD
jgi:hypothetical protein